MDLAIKNMRGQQAQIRRIRYHIYNQLAYHTTWRRCSLPNEDTMLALQHTNVLAAKQQHVQLRIPSYHVLAHLSVLGRHKTLHGTYGAAGEIRQVTGGEIASGCRTVPENGNGGIVALLGLGVSCKRARSPCPKRFVPVAIDTPIGSTPIAAAAAAAAAIVAICQIKRPRVGSAQQHRRRNVPRRL